MTVEVYTNLMQKLLKQRGLDDGAQLVFYVQGLRSKLKEHVLMAEPANLIAAIKKAKLVENTKRQVRVSANAAYVGLEDEAEVYKAQYKKKPKQQRRRQQPPS